MKDRIIDRKVIKERAHKNLKATYFKSIIVIFIFTVVISGGYNFTTNIYKDLNNDETIEKKTNFEIIDDLVKEEIKKESREHEIDEEKAKQARGILAPIVNKATRDKSAIISFFNTFKLFYYNHNISAGVVSLIASICLMLIYIFIKLVLDIGKNRYYLEARRFRGTKIDKMLFPYRTFREIHLALIIFTRNVFQTLWNFTIIGGVIKHYEYLMIPYVLAENPNIDRKEAFNLSKQMMHGLKWEIFKLDLSLIGWSILGVFTFGLSEIMYSDAYKQFIYSEVYMSIRNSKKSNLAEGELLNDVLLNGKIINEEYPLNKYKVKQWYKKDFKNDYMQKYTIANYVLFFFTFSFIGWIWEVALHFVTDGVFVNRGTLLGPWLPIYGFGGVLILILLKPFRKRPVVYFLTAMVLAGILEYSTSWFLETFKHMKWWDYSGYFLNLHGRICLEGLIVFGLGGLSLTYFIAPVLNTYYSKIKPEIATIICIVLITLFSIDLIYSNGHPNTGEGITSYSVGRIHIE